MMGSSSLDEGNIANAFKLEDSSLGDAPTGEKGPSYSQMLRSLFEEIKKSVAGESDKKEAYIRELGKHRKKIGDEIAKNAAELAKLEKEEKGKITMEGLHEGFDSSVSSRNMTMLILAHRKAKDETTCYRQQGETETEGAGRGSPQSRQNRPG